MPIESYPSEFKVLIFNYIENMAHTFPWSFSPSFLFGSYWLLQNYVCYSLFGKFLQMSVWESKASLKIVQTCVFVEWLFEVWT